MTRRLLSLHLSVDFLAIVISFVAAYWLRFNIDVFPDRPAPDFVLYARLSLFSGIIGLLSLQVCGAYSSRQNKVSMEILFRLIPSMLLSSALVIVLSFLLREMIVDNAQETLSRLIIFTSFMLSLVLLIIWRVGLYYLFKVIWSKGWGEQRLLVVGDGSSIGRLVDFMASNNDTSYRVIGYCGASNEKSTPELGDLQAVEKVIEIHGVHQVIAEMKDLSPEWLLRVMRACERTGAKFSVLPDPVTLLMMPAELHEIGSLPLISPRHGFSYGLDRYLKRCLDMIFSVVFLLILMPLSLIIALAIRLDSPGKIFYRQERVGRHAMPFWIYKFRSMFVNAENMKAPPGLFDRESSDFDKNNPDDRVTSAGYWLRRLSIDELPQFINVIKGEMSIVGPRPHTLPEVERYESWHHRRFDVRPGITGLTQISGRKNLNIDEMVKLDIYYIENWSIALDLKIMLQTLPALLRGRGAY